MSWELVLFVVTALLAGFLGWGAWLLKRNLGGSMQRLAAVEVSALPALAEECRRTVRERLAVELDPADAEKTARVLDELVLSGRLRPMFKEPRYEMRYAEPVGAFLGELILRHADAEWVADELGPKLVIHRPDGAVETHPLLKAVRHHTHGRPGQLHAYVMEAIGGA